MAAGQGRLSKWVTILVVLATAAVSGRAYGQENEQQKMVGHRPAPKSALSAEVDHSLLMLPDYSVFDILEYKIEKDGTVVISGKVVEPILKTEAVRVVEQVQGVKSVKDDISVLPLAPSDNKLRLELFRAIYSRPGLEKYRTLAIPPIHIIVDNGNVTLVGFVDNRTDKDIAGIAARNVPGSFSVKNDLQVEKGNGQ